MRLWKNDIFEFDLDLIGNDGVTYQTDYYFKAKKQSWSAHVMTFKLITTRNQGLLYGTIFYPYFQIDVISKCEGVHFYTQVEISKLVGHELE